MEMKETGIIMSGDHPQKIIDLLKTQTRRTYGLEKINKNPDHWIKATPVSHTDLWRFESKDSELLIVKCPYGQVGDRLWVRETWQYASKYKDEPIIYRADCEDIEPVFQLREKWRPSIFMPRWASRITLEIIEVRVERVQEISPYDCGEEGINRTGDIIISGKDMRRRFSILWDSLNAKRGFGWDFNPWVWPISFSKI